MGCIVVDFIAADPASMGIALPPLRQRHFELVRRIDGGWDKVHRAQRFKCCAVPLSFVLCKTISRILRVVIISRSRVTLVMMDAAAMEADFASPCTMDSVAWKFRQWHGVDEHFCGFGSVPIRRHTLLTVA